MGQPAAGANMAYSNSILSSMLASLDLGSSVAESDTVLETARIETSAFTDLLADRVDLIPEIEARKSLREIL